MQPLVSDLDVGGMSLLLLLLQALQLTAPGLADNLEEDVEREGAIRKIAVFENRIVTSSADGRGDFLVQETSRQERGGTSQIKNIAMNSGSWMLNSPLSV